jgi:hypothetical protein
MDDQTGPHARAQACDVARRACQQGDWHACDPERSVLDVLRRAWACLWRRRRRADGHATDRTGLTLQIEEDLIEEVVRMMGTSNLPTTPPLAPIVRAVRSESQRGRFAVRRSLGGAGLPGNHQLQLCGGAWERDLAGNPDPIRLLNPIASQMSVMRSSLVGSLLQVLNSTWIARPTACESLSWAGCFNADADGAADRHHCGRLSPAACDVAWPGLWANSTPAVGSAQGARWISLMSRATWKPCWRRDGRVPCRAPIRPCTRGAVPASTCTGQPVGSHRGTASAMAPGLRSAAWHRSCSNWTGCCAWPIRCPCQQGRAKFQASAGHCGDGARIRDHAAC